MPAALSVNLNKVALLRNARGHDVPNLLQAADAVIAAGCHGITVHPRRDQRHIRFDDVPVLAEHLRRHHPSIEYNVECEAHPDLIALVLRVRPDQCTLVPVTPGEVTSDHGWDLPREGERLRPILDRLRSAGIRSSLFLDCEPERAIHAAHIGADRVELYTGPFAWAWGTPDQAARTAEVFQTARAALDADLELNAGHDLDAHNLAGLRDLPGLQEVSIGHWLISRALYVGLNQAVRELLGALNPS
ncbi:MAG: pyridoxine 5'-phosphate synthase [Deltaproteobacteria bacterium]|nr:MAG: pyridoxine 5'-phosphate synthase [Deltaproteobacteria bacterium]